MYRIQIFTLLSVSREPPSAFRTRCITEAETPWKIHNILILDLVSTHRMKNLNTHESHHGYQPWDVCPVEVTKAGAKKRQVHNFFTVMSSAANVDGRPYDARSGAFRGERPAALRLARPLLTGKRCMCTWDFGVSSLDISC